MKNRWNWLLLLIILAAFALRVYRLDLQDIWWDEARNIDVAGRALAQIATAPELDIHPPVYFYLLHGWLAGAGPNTYQLPGQGTFAARFMSLWFGVLLVPLMAALGRRVGGRWTGLGAALGAAFLPFLLGEAQETRMYTVTLVWLACAGLALLRTEDREQETGAGSQGTGDRGQKSISGIVYWLLFALFSALALLTHYAAVFALVVLWGWAVMRALLGPARSRWKRLRTVLLAGLLTALLCLPGLRVALRQIPSYRNPNLVVPPADAYLAELARVYGLGEHLDAAVAQPWVWALAAWLVIGWVLGMVMRRRGNAATPGFGDTGNHREGPISHEPPLHLRASGSVAPVKASAIRHSSFVIRHSFFALAWAILPVIIYYLVIRDRATFATRYISLALPGWLLLGGLALSGWAKVGRWAGALAAVALIVILTPGLRGDLADPRFFREDTRGLVTWLKQNTDPSRDLILVDQRYPFGFYYERWNNRPDGSPPAGPPNLAPAQYLFVDINTVAERLTELAKGRDRVFWVRWFESDTDPRGAVPFLLEKFGTLTGERAFRGFDVASYEIAPDTQFELAPGLKDAAVDFGNQVRLIGSAFGGASSVTDGADATRRPEAAADEGVWAVFKWAQLPGAAQPLKVTVVLEDSDGAVVGRDDRPILNDRHLAPPEWDNADRPLGVALVKPDPATPPGTYTLKLAVYDPATLAQLPATGLGAAGSFVTLGQMQLTSATEPADPEQLPIDAHIESTWQEVRLLGRGALPAEVSLGDRLAFDLYWQAPVQIGSAGLPDLKTRLTLEPVGIEVAASVALSQETTPVPGYSTAEWQSGEVLRGRQNWQLDPDLPSGDYRLTLQMIGPEGEISPPVELGAVKVAGRPHIFAPPAQMAVASGGRIGNFARLLGFDTDPAPALAADGSATVAATSPSTLASTLFWRAEGASAAPYAVSVQLLDESGALRAQHDGQPGAGAFPTTSWVQGEVLSDTNQLELPADLRPGSYRLIVRMYDPTTLAVLPATGADGGPAGDSLTLATVEIR
jgi:mannosyltransferase